MESVRWVLLAHHRLAHIHCSSANSTQNPVLRVLFIVAVIIHTPNLTGISVKDGCPRMYLFGFV
uniref:Uncharacterized protein n=1 Tax=Anguilla anguilla TaxID=7936 RepID=A0A0E9QG71_ANGAN